MSNVQIWICLKCGTERIYGNCPYPESGKIAILKCAAACTGEIYSMMATEALNIKRIDEDTNTVEIVKLTTPRIEPRFVHTQHRYVRTEFGKVRA